MSRRSLGGIDTVSMTEKMQKLIDKITYKPNVTIYPRRNYNVETNTDHLEIVVMMLTADVNNIDQSTSISLAVRIEWEDILHLSDDILINMIYYGVMEIEQHEIKEWFRVDGVPHVDPHPFLKARMEKRNG